MMHTKEKPLQATYLTSLKLAIALSAVVVKMDIQQLAMTGMEAPILYKGWWMGVCGGRGGGVESLTSPTKQHQQHPLLQEPEKKSENHL